MEQDVGGNGIHSFLFGPKGKKFSESPLAASENGLR
jgi:hypothetical protein